jgi:hypothetical protein
MIELLGGLAGLRSFKYLCVVICEKIAGGTPEVGLSWLSAGTRRVSTVEKKILLEELLKSSQ